MVRHLVMVLMLLMAASASAQQSGRYMPVSEVKPGMQGLCRTVVTGTKVESIPIEVVGLIRGMRPGQTVILVRLKGPIIKKYRVAQGMSGSPIYINGRIVGALAFSWAFTNEALAGLTPIEDMLKLGANRQNAGRSDAVDLGASLVEPVGRTDRWFEQVEASRSDDRNRVFKQLPLPFCVNGFTPEGVRELSRRMPGSRLAMLQGGGLGANVEDMPELKLEPGSSVCIEVVRGDLSAYGIGTVTDVVGDRVLAMGHAMTNEGSVNLLMSTGFVQATISRQDVSFKLGSPVESVGTMLTDENTGMMGRLGAIPKMIPVHIMLHHADGSAPSAFRFKVTDSQKLMLSLVSGATTSCLAMRGGLAQEASLSVRTRIELEGQGVLETTNVYAGPQALADSMREIVNPIGYIVHNPFEKPRFKSIEFEATVGDDHPRAAITEVSLPRDVYRAGETMEVTVTLLPVRRARVRHTIEFKLPDDLPPGQYALTICDADSDLRIDGGERPHLYQARNLAEILEILGRPKLRTQLVCRLSSNRRGVVLGSRAFAAVPNSVLSILGGQSRTDVAGFVEPLRVQTKLPYVVLGMHRTQIEVLSAKPAGLSVKESR